MLVAYIDESYDADFYWIAALLVPEAVIVSLSNALDAVVRDAAGTWPVSESAELHGHDLFHGTDDWRCLHRVPRVRVGVYMDSMAAIAASPVDVIVRGVHRPRLLARYVEPFAPHSVVLPHLLERVDERAAALGERVLVIADEIEGAHRYRNQLWNFQRTGTQGYRPRTLTQIVDTMYFAPSHSSRLLQAADMTAFIYKRHVSRRDSESRSDRAVREIWGLLNGRVNHLWCWYP